MQHKGVCLPCHRLMMGTAAYMLYHLMLLPVKLINLFDQSRITDMEMVPLALGLCSDPLFYSLLLSRLCGGHLLSTCKVAAGIQDTSGTAAYTSSMRRADLALDDNASTPYLPYPTYLLPACMCICSCRRAVYRGRCGVLVYMQQVYPTQCG